MFRNILLLPHSIYLACKIINCSLSQIIMRYLAFVREQKRNQDFNCSQAFMASVKAQTAVIP